ncbi:MAG: c-type cytochrome [Anaerolineae bacterium]|nr:c-type cytochrome [Anaerolineae bacterium]
MLREWMARLCVTLIIIGLPGAALGYQNGIRPQQAQARVIDIKAAAPEAGGFSPANIRVAVGETVTLRFSSPDVTHGIAFSSELGAEVIVVDPGQVRSITLTFDQPGHYVYYCNIWCGADHWRMRGIIEVYDPAKPGWLPPAQPDSVIANLAAEGVNIDANLHGMHGMPNNPATASEPTLPATASPSAERGAALLAQVQVAADLRDLSWRSTLTPEHMLHTLMQDNPAVPVEGLVDVVAALWLLERPTANAETIQRYNQNCAACHGIDGSGDGFAAAQTAAPPPDFTDPAYMFSLRDDVLYAKTRRGGMGTDMPNFGTLFSQAETWALVDYLRQLSATAPAR